MAKDREARLRQRAYELWEKAGRPEGRHEEHWYQALTEIPDDEAAVGMTTPMPPAAAGRAKRGKVMAADVAPSLVKKRK
ncbi:MAG TPA: DUF2934 domain-containing protein [Bauldia sp.]|nr:DUF2934 domain-containing protein [Bauldia sp.]